MSYNFDELTDRTEHSGKWQAYGPGVLPMWVADMDFRSPQPVIDALTARVATGDFGYEGGSAVLTRTICDHLHRQYNWNVQPDEVVFLPGVVTGINVACRAFADPGAAVLVQTPVYPPFLKSPVLNGQTLQTAPLRCIHDEARLRYEIDWDVFENAITPSTQLFILCHPHNPTGVSYSETDLLRLIEICQRHNVLICSDEIHCDLLLGGTRHRPMSTVSAAAAARCVTLMAPSKTYNIPGLGCSFAIVQDAELRERFVTASQGIVPHVNALGLAAAQAAYQDGGAWLTEALAYLTANRDYLVDFVQTRLPGLSITRPDATYLAWLDCSAAGIPGNVQLFFLEEARVAFNDGAAFGQEGRGFVRLNFATQRARLVEGLERVHASLTRLESGAAC